MVADDVNYKYKDRRHTEVSPMFAWQDDKISLLSRSWRTCYLFICFCLFVCFLFLFVLFLFVCSVFHLYFVFFFRIFLLMLSPDSSQLIRVYSDIVINNFVPFSSSVSFA